jgi:hypothetical protein
MRRALCLARGSPGANGVSPYFASGRLLSDQVLPKHTDKRGISLPGRLVWR